MSGRQAGSGDTHEIRTSFGLERWLPTVGSAEINLAGAQLVPLQYDLVAEFYRHLERQEVVNPADGAEQHINGYKKQKVKLEQL